MPGRHWHVKYSHTHRCTQPHIGGHVVSHRFRGSRAQTCSKSPERKNGVECNKVHVTSGIDSNVTDLHIYTSPHLLPWTLPQENNKHKEQQSLTWIIRSRLFVLTSRGSSCQRHTAHPRVLSNHENKADNLHSYNCFRRQEKHIHHFLSTFFLRVTPFVPYYASLNLFCLCGSGGGEGERGWWPSGSSNDVRAWRHSPWFPRQALFLFFSYQLQVLVRGVAKDPLNHKHIVVYDILAFSHGCHENVSHVVVVDIKKVFQGPAGWKCVSGAKLAARNNFQTWISHEHPAHVPYKYLHGQK